MTEPSSPAAPGGLPATMRAWVVDEPGRLEAVELPVPEPAPEELLVRVRACGVCRTDLHVRDGDLPPHRSPVVPGHEIVGEVVATGAEVAAVGAGGGSLVPRIAEVARIGGRVGIPWLRHTCGKCRYCLRGQENLCSNSRYTGWDADGGYAEYATVPAAYAYPLPGDRFAAYAEQELAPLLCAGIIGYRALRRADLPAGGRLGVYGFGGSAHLTAQVAAAEGATVHVLTRSAAARALALDLGAASAREAYDAPPEPLDAAILFAPVGDLVPAALSALDRGGTLSIAGIYLTAVPSLDYERHLFQERTVRSVTANTREDGHAFLAAAAAHRLRIATTTYPLDRADEALDDLAADRVNGVAVLVP
ncbi:alcohol dehydrogenase, propanol-preferring [Actinopolymorpha cephalotaxi]|uniref:Probable alcohol dehydrogenase AdhA n=1 Tax=Actinopolymorpha cephalotaxi TaxID=504797 RepID=A0A1I3BMN7_9ACTN|nr:zinc-binding alcohol dehydrogenase family protein [Actinopolymorpha cephalotaxi]NYH82849.1 propanol-preferring alcohol dehydrogenase [Actinopolymorpha cephalotaxi]SFH63031.1 alcohol dehydrogenase, propanol-preferring [Actinopolymorpha cephalotaxi]